jgi:hypothetical protein
MGQFFDGQTTNHFPPAPCVSDAMTALYARVLLLAGVCLLLPACAADGVVLRLRGGAFWLSAVAGPEEKRAFWRQLSTAPAHWIRDRMQRLCPFGAKEANIAAKELAALMESSAPGGRLRGGGLSHAGPKAAVPAPGDDLQLDARQPFAQAGDVVVVTGASGFLAGHVIRALTDKGFKVRGTVRNLTDTAKTQHLRELFPDLELYEADLLDDGSFQECCTGARFVIHCASPFQYEVEDPERDLVEPAGNAPGKAAGSQLRRGARLQTRLSFPAFPVSTPTQGAADTREHAQSRAPSTCCGRRA